MPRVKLTDAAVQRFKADPGQRVDYFDASFPGFALRVSGPTERTPQGRKNWVLFYRYGGRQKRLTLEPPYPALSLADARRRAGDALGKLSEGVDPAAGRAEARRIKERGPDTVENMVDEFIKRRLEAKGRAPRYIAEVRRNFDTHVLPRWRGRNVREITRRDVIDLLDAITDHGTKVKGDDGRTRHVPGGPIAANRVLAAIRALFNWCLSRSVIDATPATLVERPGEEEKRDRALTSDEIKPLWQEFLTLGYPFGHFYRFLLVTGQRREEVAGMRRSELDIENATWTIPPERTKAGRAHVVPLSHLALAIIAECDTETAQIIKARASQLKGLRKSDLYLFTTTITSPISGYSRAKSKLDEAVAKALRKAKAKPIEPWRVHDLRRTAATEMARLGVSRLVISRVLNHSDRSVTGIYDRHSYLDEKRQALDVWSTWLGAAT